MNALIRNSVLVAILLISAILRFYGFDDFSLTNDELSAIYRTNYRSFSELIQKGVIATDPHPAGLQVFLYYWIKVFGDSVFWLRLPFVISSVISVYLVYRIAKEWFGISAGLLASAYFAVSEFAITYGQIARPYTIGLSLCLLLVVFWTEVIKSKKPSWSVALAYALTAAVCCYTHYFSGLFAIVVSLTGFLVLKTDRWKHFFGLNLLVVILFIPHLGITFHQLETGGLSGWLPKPELQFIGEHLWYILNKSFLILAVLLSILIFSMMRFGIKKEVSKFRWVSISWFTFPLILGYVYSIYHETVLMHRVLLFTFPFFILFMFSFVRDAQPKGYIIGMVFLLIGVGTYSTVIENRFYKKAHFEDFEILAKKVVEWDKTYGKEKITKTINLNSPKYIEYYLDEFNWETRFEIDQTIYPHQLVKFMNVVESSSTYYFVNGWACIYHPYEIEELIRQKYPYIEDSVNVFNTAISLYSKNPNFNRIAIYDSYERFDLPREYWEYQSENIDSASYQTPPCSFRMADNQEFALTLNIPKENNLALKGHILSMSMKIKAVSPGSGMWVVHVKRGEKDVAWNAMPVKDFIVNKADWNPFFMSVKLPDDLQKEDQIMIYYWNNSNAVCNFDNIRVVSYKN